jgi:hypothetical protein
MAPGMWFQIDLGQPQTFDRVVLDTVASPHDYPRAFSIEASPDGRDWRPLLSVERAEDYPEPALLDLRFPATTARHLRVQQTGSAVGWWWSIYEVYLYRPKP